jgi:LacI family gluconate utilization system Gnt-II transcriptional activator
VLNLLSYNIDGLILTGKQHTDRMIQYVRASGIPVAELMDIGGQPLDIQVGFDNEKAGWDMAHAFLESGKRKIAFFGSMDDPRDVSRFRGTEQAVAACGLKAYHITPRTISSVALGRNVPANAAVAPGYRRDFCTNDDLAVGVLLECQAQGIAVPQEIAIAGFHGLEIGRARLQKSPASLLLVMTSVKRRVKS